jgi:hypothetical protein
MHLLWNAWIPPPSRELTGMGINPSRDQLETVSMMLSHNAVHCLHKNGIKAMWKRKESKADYCGFQWNIGIFVAEIGGAVYGRITLQNLYFIFKGFTICR